MSVCSITDDVNLRFIHHKVSILPFIINKYLVKKYFDTILVNILLLLNLSPTDYSIWWFLFEYYYDDASQMVIF